MKILRKDFLRSIKTYGNFLRKEKHVNGKETIIIKHNERAGNGENVSSSLLNRSHFWWNCYADDPSLSSVMGNVQKIVYALFKSIGFVLTIWGIGQLVLAFKNEDSDSKSRAIMSIVAGIALYAFPTIAGALHLTAPSL